MTPPPGYVYAPEYACRRLLRAAFLALIRAASPLDVKNRLDFTSRRIPLSSMLF